MERADSVALTWVIADGYYLYKDKISVTTDTPNVQIGKPVLPKGEPKHDEFFGDTEVYHEVLEASLPVARAADSTGTLTLNVTYQGCAEGGLCYNPITKTVALELPPTTSRPCLPRTSAATASAAAARRRTGSARALIRDGNLRRTLPPSSVPACCLHSRRACCR